MKFLVFATIFVGVLGQLVKLPLASGNLYPLDLLVLVSVGFWIFKKLITQDHDFKLPPYFIFLCLFSFWALIGLVKGSEEVSLGEFLSGTFYWGRFVGYALFSLVIFDSAAQPDAGRFREQLPMILIASGLVLAAAGFVQLLFYPDLTSLAQNFGYDPHKNRLVSTFLDPNFTGAYLTLALILILTWGKKTQPNSTSSLYSHVVRTLIAAVLALALILTFSRSAWLLAGVALLGYGLLKSKKLLCLSLVVFLLAYFLVPRVQTRISGLTDPDDSAQLRFVSWSHATEIFGQNPIWGVGFNLYRPAQERFGFFDPSMGSPGSPQASSEPVIGGHAGSGSDSSLLLVLATTGLPGLLLFLGLLGKIMLESSRKRRFPIGLALLLSLFGLFLESQFINSLFFPQIMLWLWVLAGLV